jgi:DNA-binding response OmpR family regulator
MTDVVLVRWPEEREQVERLRASGVPRLLLLHEGAAAPTALDALEDWIRLPASEGDLRVRANTLAARVRARDLAERPTIDGDGILRYRGRWITLSPVERALAGALIDQFAMVVRRDVLGQAAWPGGHPTRNALDVHMVRLRRRLVTLGLQVRTVRLRGYLLEAYDHQEGR